MTFRTSRLALFLEYPIADLGRADGRVDAENPSVVTIAISGMLGANSYSPSPVTVQVGQQVRWRNDDSTAHTATRSGAGGFDTGVINPGQTSAPITITTAGTINYVCTLHPGMTGVLNVQ